MRSPPAFPPQAVARGVISGRQRDAPRALATLASFFILSSGKTAGSAAERTRRSVAQEACHASPWSATRVARTALRRGLQREPLPRRRRVRHGRCCIGRRCWRPAIRRANRLRHLYAKACILGRVHPLFSRLRLGSRGGRGEATEPSRARGFSAGGNGPGTKARPRSPFSRLGEGATVTELSCRIRRRCSYHRRW